MKQVRFWLPVIIWMGVIFAFSARQKIAVTDSYVLSFMFFKTLHLIEYAFLYVVTYRAVKNTLGMQKSWIWLLPFCITVLFAITDELHQSYVPTREGKPRDAIIDMFGAMFAWISLKLLLPKMPKKLKNLAKSWQIA
ncbi:MAG: VanZ family protein [Microgenomates group bacterium]